MVKVTVNYIIKTSIVSAFTIATALIWKDVIIDFISYIVPHNDQLFYKFIAAIIATLVVIVMIYTLLRTETEAEVMIRRLKNNKKNK